MVKVRAKCNVKYGNAWHMGGEEFEVEDFNDVREYADMLADNPVVRVSDMTDGEKPKRGRPKKTGE